MKIARQELIQVLRDAQILLSLPDNEFAWSSWEGVEDAVGEIEGIIEKLQSRRWFNKNNVIVLFAPTGPIQEVSVSSGWAKEFLTLASRFDIAVTRA